jgi:hypothetical protein
MYLSSLANMHIPRARIFHGSLSHRGTFHRCVSDRVCNSGTYMLWMCFSRGPLIRACIPRARIPGMHLIGVYLMGLPLIRVLFMGVPLMVPLTGVSLIGVHSTGVPLVGIPLMAYRGPDLGAGWRWCPRRALLRVHTAFTRQDQPTLSVLGEFRRRSCHKF